jgi:hypothetical protein
MRPAQAHTKKMNMHIMRDGSPAESKPASKLSQLPSLSCPSIACVWCSCCDLFEPRSFVLCFTTQLLPLKFSSLSGCNAS